MTPTPTPSPLLLQVQEWRDKAERLIDDYASTPGMFGLNKKWDALLAHLSVHPFNQVQEPVALNGVPETMRHGEGAYARCSYCRRYSLDPNTLSDDARQPVCDCGKQHGWSGSFKKPGPDALWSGRAPQPVSQPGEPREVTARERDVLMRATLRSGKVVSPQPGEPSLPQSGQPDSEQPDSVKANLVVAVGSDLPPALSENPQAVWRAIGDEAECVVQQGRKYLLLSEEMCVRLGGALGM